MDMKIAYKDRTGGQWREFTTGKRDLFTKRTPIADQYAELRGLGNVIVATVRGNKITPRFARGY